MDLHLEHRGATLRWATEQVASKYKKVHAGF